MERAQTRFKWYMDRRCTDTEFTIGDQVWLEAFNLSMDAPSKKLTAKHLGPYEILERIGSTAYHLSIPPTWHVHNIFHASLLLRTKEDTILGHVPAPQPIVKLAQQELWVIGRFVNSRWFRGKFQLKLCWEDQEEDQDDWQAYQTILVMTPADASLLPQVPPLFPALQLTHQALGLMVITTDDHTACYPSSPLTLLAPALSPSL